MMDTAKYREIFIAEAENELTKLSDLILDIERTPTAKDRYAECMRSAHTVKGAAATMGYKQIAELAHAVEDIFHAGEHGALALSPNAVSTLLKTVDEIRALLECVKDGKDMPDESALVAELRAILSETTASSDHKLSSSPQSPPTQIENKESKFTAPTEVRVSVGRLDALMGLFEEMLMLRLKLDTLLAPALHAVKSIDNPALKQKLFFVNECKTLFAELARLLSETQGELLSIRLVPLQHLFGQFPRMMRDASLAAGKRVRFVSEGGDIELDRSVLDGLGGALAHLLRNAIAHGITEEGTVRLAAVRVKDRVRITVEDDGAGVDFERVRATAVARGLFSKDDAARLSHAELLELLFRPQMSTTSEVSMLSGRGVGLYAVKTFAQDVGGSISVDSPIPETGRGTRFTLDLPVSLATVRVLLVEAQHVFFAIPFRAIVRTLEVHHDDIVSLAHQEALLVEGRTVPIIFLDHALGVFAPVPLRSSESRQGRMAVLLADEKGEVALMIDRISGEEELIVKALPPILRGLDSFSGSALLPDGRIVLLLDTHGLLQRALSDILLNAEHETSSASH